MARIMVVNDTQEILDLFDEILRGENHETVLYSYAIRDMLEVERAQPELIILDIMFGGEASGWQMLQKLRMRQSTAQIPVVICTAASVAVREMEGYLQSQGVMVVFKPFRIETLLTIVGKALALAEKTAPFLPSDFDKSGDAPDPSEPPTEPPHV